MIEYLGWICTALVLIGYFLNSRGQLKHALWIWLVGDIGWTIYDITIHNYSHLTLCIAIFVLNIYGLYNVYKPK